ncbi:tRNA1(Val) (adenine(37)-N6)-methyltransferase [Pseudanabaena mucicola]|uniref:tRNA1(Val) (adenine(37)-N6)-methyltransferase n=1 Tax=Pseudanabaena mucicola FACHB-723 TaxID=2692860 RepID=A0ABR7ZVJ1_9CYAN|nr:methyltransferase [Pseudanabaena mucicola]MBD2187572.1 methyltransferase [Pseudanabaena mucicola FACHB-723]
MNASFRFKQFTIQQDKCAMKVGTDGILLGAWADLSDKSHILDIGTGTGLLAIMLAQRSQFSLSQPLIDAVEIDGSAYAQAKENIQNSPWRDRLNIYHSRIQDFANQNLTNKYAHHYDLIIANPPFFENAYKASQPSRTLARHSDSLTQQDLLEIAQQLLNPTGHLAVIYPTDLAHNFLERARDFHLFCDRKVYIKPTPTSAVKRILMSLSPTPSPTQESTMTIEMHKHVYTQDYVGLVKEFYLNL